MSKKEKKKEIINNSDHRHSTFIARSCNYNQQHIQHIIIARVLVFFPSQYFNNRNKSSNFLDKFVV